MTPELYYTCLAESSCHAEAAIALTLHVWARHRSIVGFTHR
ncbi:hypothetical protein [Nostoc sp. 106C]|nr:hypothetical protein [Nostoc sp. 106C]